MSECHPSPPIFHHTQQEPVQVWPNPMQLKALDEPTACEALCRRLSQTILRLLCLDLPSSVSGVLISRRTFPPKNPSETVLFGSHEICLPCNPPFDDKGEGLMEDRQTGDSLISIVILGDQGRCPLTRPAG
jgi:hypothetical protein